MVFKSSIAPGAKFLDKYHQSIFSGLVFKSSIALGAGFPDNHTQLEGVTDTKRAFFMGNALVVGVVEKIGETLFDEIAKGKSV